MRITKENIWDEIKEKNNYLEVLKSDLVDTIKEFDRTPLHCLADEGVKEILKHPSVDKVKDYSGWTPLHILAQKGFKEVLSHPSVDKVKSSNKSDWTPLHLLAWSGNLTKEDLRKKYPWYKKEIKNIMKAVNEIVNTPDSIRFILED